jgi:hypothetical protein
MRLMRLSPHLNEKRPQPRGYTLGPSCSCAGGATGAGSKLAPPPRVPTNVSFQSFGRRSRSGPSRTASSLQRNGWTFGPLKDLRCCRRDYRQHGDRFRTGEDRSQRQRDGFSERWSGDDGRRHEGQQGNDGYEPREPIAERSQRLAECTSHYKARPAGRPFESQRHAEVR